MLFNFVFVDSFLRLFCYLGGFLHVLNPATNTDFILVNHVSAINEDPRQQLLTDKFKLHFSLYSMCHLS